MEKNKFGKTNLHLAIEKNNFNQVKKYASKTDLNKRDNFKNSPLHLAIKGGNLEIIKELIKYPFDIYLEDENGNDIMELLIIYKQAEIITKYPNYLFQDNPDLLFIAAKHYPEIIPWLIEKKAKIQDNQDLENFAMHYIKFHQDIQFLKKIANYINFSQTDIGRNTFAHIYLLFQKDISLDVIEYLINFNPNFFLNFPNKSSFTILDLIILEHNNFNIFQELINKYNPNLNEFDQYANTILHRFATFQPIYKDIEWIPIINYLVKKGSNLNVQNIKGDTPMHYIIKNNIPLSNEIIKKCPDFFIKNKQNKTPLNLTKKHNDILNKIKNGSPINKVFKNIIEECQCNKILDIDIIKKKNTDYTIFSGSGLNELMGYVYLKNKYPNLCFVLNKDKMYKKLDNINRYIIDYYSYNIIWDKELIIPGFITKDILKMDCRFIVLPITLIPINENESIHANYLIIDTINKTMERFEPHGGLSQNYYATEKLDDDIYNFFGDKRYTYYKPIDYIPIVGFQTLQSYENYVFLLNRIGDPEGFCASWGIWYLDLRLSNPDIHPKELVINSIKKLIKVKEQFTDFIRNYSGFLINQRNKLFEKIFKNNKVLVEEKLNKSQVKKINDYVYKKLSH